MVIPCKVHWDCSSSMRYLTLMACCDPDLQNLARSPVDDRWIFPFSFIKIVRAVHDPTGRMNERDNVKKIMPLPTLWDMLYAIIVNRRTAINRRWDSPTTLNTVRLSDKAASRCSIRSARWFNFRSGSSPTSLRWSCTQNWTVTYECAHQMSFFHMHYGKDRGQCDFRFDLFFSFSFLFKNIF